MWNISREAEKYVKSKRGIWSDRTINTVRAVLHTLGSNFGSPAQNYQNLLDDKRSRYTIKVYFTIAAKFETEVFRTKNYRRFLERNRSAFKNCYKEKTRIVKPEEFEKFLMVYKNTNHNMYNLLVLMGTAGLRISEALAAKWEDIQDGFIKVIGKGSKQRLVPFDVNSLIKEKATDSGKIIGKVAYRFLFNRDLKPFTPHDFRAYYATFIANHPELSIKDAALLLGHSSITTTSRYVRSDLNRIAKVLRK